MASNRNNEIKSQLTEYAIECMTKKDALEAIDYIYRGDHNVYVWTNNSIYVEECRHEIFAPCCHPAKKNILAVLIREGNEFRVWVAKDAHNNDVNHICQTIRSCALASDTVDDAESIDAEQDAEQVEAIETAEQVETVEAVETVEVPETPKSVWNGKTFAELSADQAEPNKDRDEQLTVTHSSMHCFMGCRQKYDYRYNRHIVAKEKADALTFGSAVHAGLEYWFKTGIVQAAVDAAGAVDGLEDANRIKAQALVRKYTSVYADEPFNVLEIEHTFTQRARHPRTNKLSKRITYTGKIDGLIEMDGELWILEHKTATVADDAYFDCKDFDDQIALYAIAMSDELGKPVVGALYDVILKPQLRMSKGETDDEYAARVAASKTGKIKRKEAETPEQFAERVGNAVTEFNYMRRWIRFDPVDLIRKKAAFWAASHDMANGDIYQNTCACNSGYGACEYRHLCKARGDLGKCAEYYETRAPHEELVDKGSAE